MSLNTDLLEKFKDVDEVVGWDIDDVDYHGEKAKQVTVVLKGGTKVGGIFTVEDKDGFGGVEFTSRKDVAGLMASKVRSVLAGTAEAT